MKKIFLFAGAALLIGLSSFTTKMHNEKDLTLNASVSSVEWVGKKVAGQHNGTIAIKGGSLHLHDGNLSGGKVTIDMSTIACSDLEGDWAAKLVGHLNSKDFFDVENHKTSTLEIKSVKKIEGNKHTIMGDLTIKGITKAIEFPVTVEMKEGKLAAYAEVKVDRTLYDIKYGSGKFFEGLGDKMIDDHFTIKFKIAAE